MAKKKTKKISLIEFKAWLDGIEEMQPEGWSPNAEQWKTIRNKFDLIEIPKEKKVNNQSQIAPAPTRPLPRRPSIPAPPPVGGGIPESIPVEMSPAAKKLFDASKTSGVAGATPQTPSGAIEHPPAGTSAFE